MKSKKHTLTDIDVYEEAGQYYLSLKYILEYDTRIEALEIPKVYIPINKLFWPFIEPTENNSLKTSHVLILGGHEIRIDCGDTSSYENVPYERRMISEIYEELTLSEIEERLGYKIKIISEDDENV
jgi:hypothetical protein